MDTLTLGVTANFTATPLSEPLEFWFTELGLAIRPDFAPYNQVFQSLLDPLSGQWTATVVLARFDELQAGSAADDLASAVLASARRTGTPHLVLCCPPPPADQAVSESVRAAEVRLAALLEQKPETTVITHTELLDRYPVADPYDAYGDRSGHVPYTPALFAALATAIARWLHARLTPRPKVIVVDADNTLWDGVVGEDGVSGVVVGSARRQLQQTLLDQRALGRLICIASKNVEADVQAVLDEHAGMLLRAEHVTASRINWRPKSANLVDLAAELKLGLDSFVFIDDNPVECAEVQAACPQVTVLALPADPTAVEAFLRHCWPLDQPYTTDDDRVRADRYAQQRKRDEAKAGAGSLADFLSGLGIVVGVRPMRPDDVARAAQLTQRTNQFNLTTIRRTPGELATLPDGLECLVVEVRDRFGGYGQVGVVVVGPAGDTLEVETFLLSCRVLGRGVEYQVLNAVGTLARGRGLSTVTLRLRPTDRNQPAAEFLTTLPADASDDGCYTLPAQVAAEVRYEPRERPVPESSGPQAAPSAPAAAAPKARSELATDPDLLRRIAVELHTPEQVLAAIAARRAARVTRPEVVTDDPVEAGVAQIWGELLEFPPVTVHDNFHELGGHSLLLVQFAARVRDVFGVELPIDALFTSAFTITDIAREIRDLQLTQVSDDELGALLAELDSLSEEEVRALLEAER